ncbi:hypothetical protein [Pseudomonas protegens]|uniref:hypothetical protein n=1 Tax=Pseudomonas protegens TaxID=380021 RepID=UPI00227FA96D|nr:hypothetical protein [Pseudomonas protegens]MCY7264341.1 hypothetical protein [Pseudomonas protegens]MDP9514697.1 hypothetical protein [Pseudomonas protegens]
MEFSLNYPAVGAICAALIAGLISFVVTVLAKDQKVSEFRQAWIDALRNDAAELVSHLAISALILKGQRILAQQGEVITGVEVAGYKEFVVVKGCVLRIRLRLNPKEHQQLLSVLNKLDIGEGGTIEHAESVLNEFTTEVQKVLKSEWGRVKKGELSIRCVRWGSLVLFCSVFAFSIYHFWPTLSSGA